MQVTAIVVNFNSAEPLQRAIDSLIESDPRPDILLVDNASNDGSAVTLEERYSEVEGVRFQANAENIGFARAVNACAARADSEALLILNPDCALEQGALARLSEALAADDAAGLCAPVVLDASGAPEPASLRALPNPWRSFLTVTGLWRLGRWFVGFRGVSRIDQPLPSESSRVEAVSGACLLIRRSVFEQLGGFDESYELHCEDLDFMARLAAAGWHCVLVPAARARHDGGVSSRSRPVWVHWQKHRSMVRYYRKFQAGRHAPPLRWLVYLGIWLHYLAGLPWVLLRR